MIEIDAMLNELELSDVGAVEIESVSSAGPVWALEMPMERSFDRWQLAAQRAAPLGYVAVGVGDSTSLDGLREHFSLVKDWDHEESIQLANELDIAGWLKQRRNELEEDGAIPRGPWPDEAPRSVGFWFPFDSKGNHLDPWWMLLIPAREPWQAPAVAAYGNWNECPPAHVHTAVAHDWERRFGATIAAMGSDTIEFMVARPPQENKRALSLAMEHYLYCPDIVEQECGTVENLAAQLKGGIAWSFWWD